jgi:hypothetical protein
MISGWGLFEIMDPGWSLRTRVIVIDVLVVTNGGST